MLYLFSIKLVRLYEVGFVKSQFLVKIIIYHYVPEQHEPNSYLDQAGDMHIFRKCCEKFHLRENENIATCHFYLK